MDNCVFCKIIRGVIPSYKVWEDDEYLAFLTIAPINPGHTLLIPKTHIDYIFDLDDKTLGELLLKAKPISQALKKAFNPKTGKIGMMVAGGEVPHVHIHLIPMDQERDLNFEKANSNISKEELSQNLENILKNLN